MKTVEPKPARCPCEKKCPGRRKAAVNAVLNEGVITSQELKNRLVNEVGLGEATARKNLRFLHYKDMKSAKGKEGCIHITVFTLRSNNIYYYRGRNKVFISKFARKKKIHEKIRTLLTGFQNSVLRNLEKEIFSTYYLSSYEIRKLVPTRADYTTAALNRLTGIGFLEEVQISLPRTEFYEVMPLGEILKMISEPPKYKLRFYTSPRNVALLKREKSEAVINEMTEFEITRRIQKTLMKIYPTGLVEFKGTLRTKEERLLKLTKGMSFDILLPLKHRINGKKFIAIDVYTRFRVTDHIVQCFAKKIEYGQMGFGLLFAKDATRRATYLCRQYNIEFISFKDLQIDHDEVREGISRKVKSLLGTAEV